MEYKATARKTKARDMDTKEIESPHDIACKAAQAGYLATMRVFDREIQEKLNCLYSTHGNDAFKAKVEKEIELIQASQLKAVRTLSGIKPAKWPI